MDYSQFTKLEFRRKFFKLFGAEITVVDPAQDKLVGFINVKAWRLKEDVRLYTDRDKQTELIRIGARSVMDFAGTYDVFKGEEAVPIFSLRRKGLRSTFVRDQWLILDAGGNEIGQLNETSSGLALARRWIDLIPIVGPIIDLALAFAPQSYRIQDGSNKTIGTILRRKNPFLVKLELDLSHAEVKADQFLGIAICSLISVIDSEK